MGFIHEDFVRHYEDAARILRARSDLPCLDDGIGELVETLAVEDKKPMPAPDDPAFNPSESERWSEVERAWHDIAPLFWGDRIALDDACAEVREFLEEVPR